MVRFSASQSVAISVPTQPLSIETYLSEPKRLVSALVEEQQVESLSPHLFRVRVRPIKFVGLTIQPICDIEVFAESLGTVKLKSDTCQLEGYETFNKKFSLNMPQIYVNEE